jgi:D-2-hydroxyacid dehydrogenase (NADP+)
VAQFDQRGVRFTNTPGIHGEAVGEHVFGMAFAFSRCLLAYRDHQREHDWAKRAEPVTDYAGEVCCVVGLGRIGEAVAERARVFDMLVRGVKRRTEGYQGAAQEVYPADDLYHALTDAMLVVVCIPLTDRTRGLLGDPELSVLADSAVIVNVSRGAVIEMEALLAALDDGRVRGAGLDVFTEEPLPENAPFWDRDDVLVTPHRAAASDKYPQRFLETFQEQYTSLTETGRLEHQLTTRSDESSG